jgi:tetratricopeptide (TPR) repeat protein
MDHKQHAAGVMNGKSAIQAPPPTIQDIFATGLRYHQAGHLSEAERVYRQILSVDPRHADSLHLLGLVGLQTGRKDFAADMISQAIKINPTIAAYHSNLGAVLSERGLLDDAVACYRRALALKPDYPEAHNNLATTLREQGKLDEAIVSYRLAIKLKPDYPEAHFNLGISLAKQGHLDDAVGCYSKALALRPNFPEAHDALASTRRDQGKLDEAVSSYRQAISLKPNYPQAHNNLGSTLKEQGRLDEAIASCRAAIVLKPDFPEAYNNLGSALAEQGAIEDAVASYRQAIDLKPDFPEAYNNLATGLREQGRLQGAVACYRRAIALSPQYPDAHFGLAMALLARGDMAEGWQEYEWRWQTPQMIKGRRRFPQPRWHGEAAAGQTLLLYGEQGFGDTLQFCRYATLASERGLRVILEVEKPLVRLLRGLAGVEQVVARGEALPPFDLHCPLLSTPLAFGTAMETIPAANAYLHAESQQVATWRNRLAAMANQDPRIGLVWAGSPRLHSPALAAVDRRRSLAPDRLAPLLEIPGLHVFSLQKSGPKAPENLAMTDMMDEMTDFADTAALIANLDLVISVDTAVVHLAAALGKPVWMLDRFDSCWRWLTDRRDSPWYPSVRLYRQPQPHDWDSVLAEVARDLSGLASDNRLASAS